MLLRHIVLGAVAALTFGAVLWVNSNDEQQVEVAEPVSHIRPKNLTDVIAPTIPAKDFMSAKTGNRSSVTAVVDKGFAVKTWHVAPPQDKPEIVQPVAPPLPFTFVGKFDDAGSYTVFIEKAGRNFIVKEGDLIDGVYRVDAIKPTEMVFTYIPMNESQTLVIGEAH